MDIMSIIRNRARVKVQREQNTERARQKSRVDAIPLVALIVANLLVLSLDYRVVEAVYKLTDSIMLAAFALFTSGAMFILWFDILYQYLLATFWQKNIALAFSGLSLVTAGIFAFLDYNLSMDIGGSKTIPIEANLLFAGMVILTIANGVGLFVWYSIDEQVKRKEMAAKHEAESDFDQRNVDIANSLLERAGEVLEKRAALEKRFGKDAVDAMLQSLAGLEVALGVDIDGDGKVGNAPAPQMRAYAHDEQLPTVEPQNPTPRRP